jgi:FMN phosphatase YigB (HAD superfamily)
MIKSVVFIDLDNTILEGPFESVVFPTVFEEISTQTNLEISEVRKLIVEENLARQADPKFSAMEAMDWDDIIQTTAHKLRARVSLNVEEIVTRHAYPPYSHLIDGAKNALSEIRNRYRVVVAATKGLKKYQFPVLVGLDILQLFDEVLTPDSHQALKHSIEFYGNWPQKTELQISVGDHYHDDVQAPSQFGFQTIWKVNQDMDSQYNLGNYPPQNRPDIFPYMENQLVHPNAIILHLNELPSTLNMIEHQS